MRTSLIRAAISVVAVVLWGSALAQPPAGFERIYNGPTGVNLAGRPVVADIALYTDREALKAGDVRLALVTDVTDFIEETERDLENWIATHQERCGNRWGAGEPLIEFPPGAIRFALFLELEVWNCGLDGKGEPGRLGRETGKVDVTLHPYVDAGKLQARLGAFTIGERSGVTKYLPLEFLAKQAAANEIKKLNENRKFYRPPQPLYGEGFEYESIVGKRQANGRVVITALYKAKGSAATLQRLVAKVREEGLTQERAAP